MLMSSVHFSPGLFVEHADEDVFVLVDLLHDVRVALSEADEEGLEKVGVVEDLVTQELELFYITKEGQRVGDTRWFASGGGASAGHQDLHGSRDIVVGGLQGSLGVLSTETHVQKALQFGLEFLLFFLLLALSEILRLVLHLGQPVVFLLSLLSRLLIDILQVLQHRHQLSFVKLSTRDLIQVLVQHLFEIILRLHLFAVILDIEKNLVLAQDSLVQRVVPVDVEVVAGLYDFNDGGELGLQHEVVTVEILLNARVLGYCSGSFEIS